MMICKKLSDVRNITSSNVKDDLISKKGINIFFGHSKGQWYIHSTGFLIIFKRNILSIIFIEVNSE